MAVTATVIATSSFASTVTYLAGTLVGKFLISSAIGLALNALAPKPKSSSQTGIGGYRLNGKRSNLDHQVIYGETRVGGAIVFEESTGNVAAELYRVIAHTGHPIAGYGDLTLDGNVISSWKVVPTGEVVSSPSDVPNGTFLTPNNSRYDYLASFPANTKGTAIFSFYDGKQTAADGDLAAKGIGWTTDHVLNGCAYVICRFYHGDGSNWPSGVPETLFNIKGKEVYDPRTGTTAWSDNPALCIRDYLTSSYGLNEDDANIDDTYFSTAANVCDETVSGQKRYTCNGAFTTAVTPIDLLNEMLTSMGGLLWYAQGKWRTKPAYYTAPTLNLTLDDLRSNIAVKTRHSRRDNFNVVKGVFKGPETDNETTDYPEVRNQAFIDADNGQESVVDLNLPFTDSSAEARRIARIFLERNRQQLTVSASFGMRAFKAQVGDTITLTVDRFGWVEKEFEVASWTFGLNDGLNLEVQMTLREISASVFDEIDDGVVYERDNTELPNPFLDEAPRNLTVSDAGYTAEDGTFVNAFLVDWDEPNARFVDSYVLEWRRQGESKYNSVKLETTEYQIAPVVENVTYDIRVKAVNAFGASGPYASTTAQVGGDTTAPALPTGLTAEGDLRSILVSWVNPPDRDFDFVEIWESTDNNLSNASQLATAFGSSFNRMNLTPLQTLYYWVRAVDFSGNKSGFVGPVSGTTRQITTADIGDAVIPWDALDPTVENVIDSKISTLEAEVADEYATITEVSLIENDVDGLEAKYGVTIDNNGNITGYQLLSGAAGSAFNVRADQFAVFNSTGTGGDNPFTIFTSDRVVDGEVFPAGTYVKDAYIDKASIIEASIDTLKIAGNAVTIPTSVSESNAITGNGGTQDLINFNYTIDRPATIIVQFNCSQEFISGPAGWRFELYVGGGGFRAAREGSIQATSPTIIWSDYFASAGTYNIKVTWFGANSTVKVTDRNVSVLGAKR